MGLLDWLFPKEEQAEPKALARSEQFKLLTAYEPVFRNYSGSIYESDLVRSAIEAKARHISKLKVEMQGEAQAALKARMRHAPNPWQTWPQFLARCSTILDCTNNLFILPVQSEYFETIGFFPVLPDNVKLIEDRNGKLWLRYTFRDHEHGVIEFDRCAYLNKHQYKSDFFGDSNRALNRTLDMIAINDQAIREAVKSSATYRFMAQVSNFTSPDDLALERQRYTRENLSGETGGGLLLFPNTYKDIRQIDSKPYTVDPDEMKQINENVFNYFGVSEKVMQGSANSDELDAFFNSAVEPFAIALSEALSRAIYTDRERSFGNHVYVNSNRLQYMTQTAKVSLARELGDRGILTINEIRELFNYEPIAGGDMAYIRGEYKPVETIEQKYEAPAEEEQEDGREIAEEN
ncbi:MAG: phage portal protein [Eubacterium sp.]|nr:phage portal protein [Eubacterium sp.]